MVAERLHTLSAGDNWGLQYGFLCLSEISGRSSSYWGKALVVLATRQMRGRFAAPEDFGRIDSLCYALDNSEVKYAIEDEFTVRVSNLIEKPAKIRREMVVRLAETSPKVTVEHRIIHEGGGPLEIAPWGLSVMAPCGYAVLSHPPLGTHPEAYLPNRVIVVWPFTDLSDKRFRVGRQMMRLKQAQGLPFKIGLRHPEGWVAYVLDDHLFIKSVPLIEDAVYPDMGSNFETFTNADFLELETLGPLKKLSAGETALHYESWVVFLVSVSQTWRTKSRS
jgi:hypothetical protein